MAFGKTMADGLEAGDLTGDMALDLVMERLPKYEVMDKEFYAEVPDRKRKKNIVILCKPDSMKADMSAFIEYKTGMYPWSKKKVDDFGQITFYAVGMYLRTGKIPAEIELVHVLTAADPTAPAGIRATGEVKRYPTRRSMVQVLSMVVRMKKTWAGIEKACEEELI